MSDWESTSFKDHVRVEEGVGAAFVVSHGNIFFDWFVIGNGGSGIAGKGQADCLVDAKKDADSVLGGLKGQ